MGCWRDIRTLFMTRLEAIRMLSSGKFVAYLLDFEYRYSRVKCVIIAN